MKERKKWFLEVLKVFDYFKEAFRVNKENKIIYKPKIVLMIFNQILVLIVGIVIYLMISGISPRVLERSYGVWDVLGPKIGVLGIMIGVFILVSLIASLILDPGVNYMYVKATYEGQTSMEDFWYGVNNYFWKFFLGKLLVMLAYMVLIIPLSCLGIFGGSIAFVVITVFLSVWKVSLIVNNNGAYEAIKDSVSFGKNHIIPMFLMVALNNTFAIGGGSSSNSFNYNRTNQYNRFKEMSGDNPLQDVDFSSVIDIVSKGTLIVLPIVIIASICVYLFTMVIEVFFGLAYVTAYKENFVLENENREGIGYE